MAPQQIVKGLLTAFVMLMVSTTAMGPPTLSIRDLLVRNFTPSGACNVWALHCFVSAAGTDMGEDSVDKVDPKCATDGTAQGDLAAAQDKNIMALEWPLGLWLDIKLEADDMCHFGNTDTCSDPLWYHRARGLAWAVPTKY